jgi:lysophospholipase L1-like esterase
LAGQGREVRLAGIAEARPIGRGLRLSRLPEWTRSRTNDPALAWTATMLSGARIELETDASVLELDVQLTRLSFAGVEPRPAPFDLEVDGEVVAGRRIDEGHLLVFSPGAVLGQAERVRGGVTTVRFAELAPGPKLVRLWLPPSAWADLLELRVDAGAHARPPQSVAPRWVHYGSSVSQCVESDRPTGVWPVIAARRGGLDLHSLAMAGQCHLDPFVARTIVELDPDLVSLELGINIVNGDTLRERAFVPAVHGFLDTIRERRPGRPIVVVTPLRCPAVEHLPGPTTVDGDGRCAAVARTPAEAAGSLTLTRVRELLAEVVAARAEAGDAHLHLVDGPDLFGDDDLDHLPDGLHPDAEGYRRIGARFGALVLGAGRPFG